jgi:hypothetical protein
LGREKRETIYTLDEIKTAKDVTSDPAALLVDLDL